MVTFLNDGDVAGEEALRLQDENPERTAFCKRRDFAIDHCSRRSIPSGGHEPLYPVSLVHVVDPLQSETRFRGDGRHLRQWQEKRLPGGGGRHPRLPHGRPLNGTVPERDNSEWRKGVRVQFIQGISLCVPNSISLYQRILMATAVESAGYKCRGFISSCTAAVVGHLSQDATGKLASVSRFRLFSRIPRGISWCST